MPTRSPEQVPTADIRALGLPGRAVSALTGAGITAIEGLAALTDRELAAIRGLGPGTIAAIRRVVPAPAPSATAPGDRPNASVQAVEDEAESPNAPEIPSFASLRGPRRRSAVDALATEPEPLPSSATARPAPRPAEYADLLRFGVRVARATLQVPVRLAGWAARRPARCARRLLGE